MSLPSCVTASAVLGFSWAIGGQELVAAGWKCHTEITRPRSNFPASPWRHATHNPEVAANKARDKKAAMDYLAHVQAAMDARD